MCLGYCGEIPTTCSRYAIHEKCVVSTQKHVCLLAPVVEDFTLLPYLLPTEGVVESDVQILKLQLLKNDTALAAVRVKHVPDLERGLH